MSLLVIIVACALFCFFYIFKRRLPGFCLELGLLRECQWPVTPLPHLSTLPKGSMYRVHGQWYLSHGLGRKRTGRRSLGGSRCSPQNSPWLGRAPDLDLPLASSDSCLPLLSSSCSSGSMRYPLPPPPREPCWSLQTAAAPCSHICQQSAYMKA